jgi:ABC-type sugar transport system ATPase subunit
MSTSLEFRGISKSFPGVRALRDISFHVESGKVTALLGENGAGKSTLLKILSGDLTPDEGEILLNGEAISFASPIQAIHSGVSVIYQERQLMPKMSVMENLFPGALPKNALGFVDFAALRKKAEAVIAEFHLPIDPDEQLERLPIAYQQLVEIMKAYLRDSDIIAFDEPTAPLTDTEIAPLFDLIEKLKKEGKAILYVSHRLSEIFQVTDNIVVLKDGELAGTFETKETTEAQLIKAMVGREIGDTYAKLDRNTVIGEPILEVRNLYTSYVYNVSFTLHRGEILGLAGLVGAGRTELARALFGLDPIISGEIILDGKPVHFLSPKDAIGSGIALCPEDRKEDGLVLDRSINDNVCMPVLSKLISHGFLDQKERTQLALDAVSKYSIKTPTVAKLTRELSGGNQQKVILGRWTSKKVTTKLLILDEPTKGIDVGTKAEIYQIVCDFAKEGIGVIFISSELTEVINVADTIIVMYNGHTTGQLAREDASEENVLTLAMHA